VRGFAPKDGKKLWEYALKDRLQESATTPVKAGDLILAASITKGMAGLKLEEKEGKLTVKEAWKNPKLTCYFSTPIPLGKHVYVVTGQLALFPNSTLHCVEIESGKILWSKPKVGKWHAAMLKTADDKLLLLSDNGRLALLEPNEKEYKELASAQLAKGEQIWAHPALANGKVYFRDDKSLICLQMPEQGWAAVRWLLLSRSQRKYNGQRESGDEVLDRQHVASEIGPRFHPVAILDDVAVDRIDDPDDDPAGVQVILGFALQRGERPSGMVSR